MATIVNPTLTVEDFSTDTVKVTIKYTLFQHPLEYWARTVYREEICLIGDDAPHNPAPPDFSSDIIVHVFPYYTVVNPYMDRFPPPIFVFDRVRVRIVAKAAMNEDPGFTNLGLPKPDEVFGLILLRTVANPVEWPPIPKETSAQTNTVHGIWG
ncbi:hypothetical protein [Candidatus Electronema sp. PJ]|uniref:hypothetical protein n=1 Tax=Candidatus Electronema sp. PJ TaxID=3401572 RepID=UPI003AA97834